MQGQRILKWRYFCRSGDTTMALQRSGGFLKSGGVTAAIAKNLRNVNLKPVKRITIQYDPFNENVKNIRDFNSLILSKKVVKTNLSCLVKTNIVSDRSESEIKFNLANDHVFVFKCANLSTLEIFEQINKFITPLAPSEDTTPSIETKSEKKGKKKK